MRHRGYFTTCTHEKKKLRSFIWMDAMFLSLKVTLNLGMPRIFYPYFRKFQKIILLTYLQYIEADDTKRKYNSLPLPRMKNHFSQDKAYFLMGN